MHYEGQVQGSKIKIMTNTSMPTPDHIERIAAIDDPIVRNLQITQCYHELAAAMGRLLPGGANWCAVATWASRQAGSSIRQEDLRQTLQRLLRDSREATEAIETLHVEGANLNEGGTESLAGAAAAIRDAINPAAAFDRTADAVARGNLKVFAEIGLAFSRFLALFSEGQPADNDLADFLGSLRPGDPPAGQRLLRYAFKNYRAAMDEQDAKARAELMLLANLEIGFHEQTRLQPEIREAMDAPVYDPGALRRRLLDELFPDPASQVRLAAARLMGRADPLLAARDRLAHETQRLGRLVITEAMMTLELSGGRVLRLGKPLRAEVPELLREIANSDLRALVNWSPDKTDGPADWSYLPDRMRFIANLFRAYHEDATLYDPPFTAAQAAELKAGRRPAGV